MPRNIRVPLGYYDGTVAQPLSGSLYLRPTRQDALFQLGSSWYPWQVALITNNALLRPGGWIEVPAVNGVVTFVDVPFTDTQVQLPLGPDGGVGPSCEWQILDVQAPGRGQRMWQGPLPSSLGSGASTLQELMAISYPGNWRCVMALLGSEPREDGTFSIAIPFSQGVQQQSVGFPFVLAAPPGNVTFGCTTAKDGAVYSAGILSDPSSGAPQLDAAQMTVRLSGPPTSNVIVYARIQP